MGVGSQLDYFLLTPQYTVFNSIRGHTSSPWQVTKSSFCRRQVMKRNEKVPSLTGEAPNREKIENKKNEQNQFFHHMSRNNNGAQEAEDAPLRNSRGDDAAIPHSPRYQEHAVGGVTCPIALDLSFADPEMEKDYIEQHTQGQLIFDVSVKYAYSTPKSTTTTTVIIPQHSQCDHPTGSTRCTDQVGGLVDNNLESIPQRPNQRRGLCHVSYLPPQWSLTSRMHGSHAKAYIHEISALHPCHRQPHTILFGGPTVCHSLSLSWP